MLSGGRFFFKTLDSIPKLSPSVRHNTVVKRRDEKADKPPENVVVIPRRIERGPTDILKALSATVGYDPTGYHYKYPDDPFFKCNSRFQKRLLALSLESGKKSAKWIIQNHPGLFQRRLSEPLVKAFRPKLFLKKQNTDCTEEDLIATIGERNVPKSIEMYETLKNGNCDVSQSTKQCLLELVCFYNCEPVEEIYEEEKWFSLKNKEEGKKFWKKEGFAEKLFSEMDTECPLANSALILGMFKHKEPTSAMEHFDRAKKANVKLSVEVYNSVIENAFFDLRKEPLYFREMMTEMSNKQIKPNAGTLRSLLITLLKPKYCPRRKLWADEIFQEFRMLGIKPSLACYCIMFEIYSKVLLKSEIDASLVKEEVKGLMSQIEHEEHEIQHEDDLSFFFRVSFIMKDDFEDSDLLMRLVDMYFRNNNSKFVVTYSDLNMLLGNLCMIYFQTKPIETAMEVFQRYAFKKFSPDVKTLKIAVETIGENLAAEYVPRIWTHLKEASFGRSRVLLAHMLKLSNCFSDEESLKILHEAAEIAMSRIEERNIAFEEEDAFSSILITFVKTDDREGVLSLLDTAERIAMDVLNKTALKAAGEYAVSKADATLILKILPIARESDAELASELAKNSLAVLSGEDKELAQTFVTEGARKKKKEGKEASGSQETGNRDGGSRETGSEETGNRESGNRENGNRESGSRGSGNREGGSRETGSEETGNRESGNRENGNREGGSRGSGGRGSEEEI